MRPGEPILQAPASYTITRVFAAARRLVWDTWTREEHMLRWFCPEGFTVTAVSLDARPGGAWRSTIRAADGREYVEAGVYREVEPPRRLVFTHRWEKAFRAAEPQTLVTVELEDIGGRTRMRFTQAGLATPASCASHRRGWGQAFDFLEAHLAGNGDESRSGSPT